MRSKLNGFVTDTKVIVDETLNILLAGRDTVSIFPPVRYKGSISSAQTASLLTFVTYCLAMYPEVLRRLRQEIFETVGRVRAPR